MPEIWVYRRVAPDQFKNNRLRDSAFRPRKGEGLSIFQADMVSPRSMLQGLIDDLIEKSNSPDKEKAENAKAMLTRYGNTVELLVQSGWRIARVPLSYFSSPPFRAEGPNSKGHWEIFGERNDFVQCAGTWIEKIPVLSESECCEDTVITVFEDLP